MCLGCSRHRAESYYLKQLDTRRISKEITNSRVSLWKHLTQRSPKRSPDVSFYKKKKKNSHSFFLFWYLIENWAWGLPTITIKMLNTPSRWHAPSSGTCTHECCWVSVDCLLLIYYVWFNADSPKRWLLARVRSLWAQSPGIWEREEAVEWNGGVTTDTSQETFEKSLALPILVQYLCSAMWTEKLSRGLLRTSAKLSTEILLSC